jgi:DNA damage-binding protein 1
LQIIGRFHLGEFVNRFLPGSLVMKLPDSDLSKVPTVLFGTINGVIGVIASLPEKDYKALTRLQDALRKVVKGVGGLDHNEWRSYPSPFSRSANDSTGFVDGDLIEQLLDLKDDTLDAVLSGMNDYGPPETILRLVEDLSRLH